MNIRMPQPNQETVPDSSSGPPPQSDVGTDVLQPNMGPSSVGQMPGFPDGANFGGPPGMPVWAPHGMGPGGIHHPQHGPSQEERRSVSC